MRILILMLMLLMFPISLKTPLLRVCNNKSEKTEVKKVDTKSIIKKTQSVNIEHPKYNYDSLLSSIDTIENFSGRASYYGDEFQGRKTASGELFDQNKLTAAHRTLPFGTKLLVRNPKNDKSIVVTINDRGPFVGNRVLDLSKYAAKKLSIVRSGTCYLEIFKL